MDNPDDDYDYLTSLLIAQLTLDDITEIQSLSDDMELAGPPLTDEVLAFQMQKDSLKLLLDDYAFAQSLDRALETDQAHLRVFSDIERGEQQDREAALAASRGQGLPVPTPFQQLLERGVPTPVVQDNLPSEGARDDYVDSDLESELSYVDALDVSPHSHQKKPRSCVICTEDINPKLSLRAPCGHDYCRECLTSLVENFTRDESLFPLRCCQTPLPVDDVVNHLFPDLLDLFRARSLEFSTPTASRLYCCNTRCSVFMGSTDCETTTKFCPSCGSYTCTGCKAAAHVGEDCVENAALIELKTLAANQHWQTCPGCHAIVELHMGCYHMTCRCRTQFCYLCSARWKTCRCEQWDEHRLLNAAEHQVDNQYGANAREQQPALYQRRVQDRRDALRQDHACNHPGWRLRQGSAMCEECGNFLARYLLRCNGCQMLACVRCTRNRL